MKQLRPLCLIFIMTLALSIPAFAGDMATGITGEMGSPGVTGDIGTPGITGDIHCGVAGEMQNGIAGDMQTPGVAGDILGPGITGDIGFPGIVQLLLSLF